MAPARGWLLPQWMLGLCSVFISLRLVFPDSHLEIQPELVTSFFCSKPIGLGWGQEKAEKEEKNRCISTSAEPRGGSEVPRVLQTSQGPQRNWGAPATLLCLQGGSLGLELSYPCQLVATEPRLLPKSCQPWSMAMNYTVLKSNLCKPATF